MQHRPLHRALFVPICIGTACECFIPLAGKIAAHLRTPFYCERGYKMKLDEPTWCSGSAPKYRDRSVQPCIEQLRRKRYRLY